MWNILFRYKYFIAHNKEIDLLTDYSFNVVSIRLINWIILFYLTSFVKGVVNDGARRALPLNLCLVIIFWLGKTFIHLYIIHIIFYEWYSCMFQMVYKYLRWLQWHWPNSCCITNRQLRCSLVIQSWVLTIVWYILY